jgi:asparagine synthase (glutamine-hydrolysing)
MCGIAGLARGQAETARAEDVHRMCQTIVHRGPDDEGIYARGRIGLGMRRLSIIDLSGGHQPIHNEDQTIWVVYNGEIYNFPELRADLERKGHQFYTHSDTEVIVHLYEDLGAESIKKLRGMFSIALYDETRQCLLLARDRLGKKPLHYALDGDRLYFGSEIKAILAVAPHLAEVDTEGILQFFYFDYIPDPHTAYKRIKKLPPGYFLEFVNGTVRVEKYWDLPAYSSQDPGSEETCLEELDRRLGEAVRMRLISDVPLGALLSGGVDSSVVVALMARASSAPVKTFSIGFENEDFDELRYARLVAQRFGTDHHEMIVKPNIGETLEKLTYMLEEPFGDSSMIPTYHVSAMARKHVTVALSGDGGDELFAGYDRYVSSLKRRYLDNIPQWTGELYRNHVYHRLPVAFRGRKLSWNLALHSRDRYLDSLSFLPACHRERALFSQDFLALASGMPDPLQQFREYYDRGASDALSRLLYLDTKTYLTADVLAKVDRMSMATSLEVRSPILDHVFVEWVTGLPTQYKFRHGTRKYILKKLAERLEIPAELLHRRKQGFALPLVHWMRQEKDHLLGVLLEPQTLQRGYFNPRAVRKLVDEHVQGSRDRSGVLWQLLVFELWHRNFLGHRHDSVPDQPQVLAGERVSPLVPNRSSVAASEVVSCPSPISEERASRIRVAIVAPSLRRVGGQAVQASLLLKNWENDPAVEAEFVPIDPQLPTAIAWIERVPYLRTLGRIPWYCAGLWEAAGRADVVHIFSASYWSFLLAPVPAWMVSCLRGKKTVLNYRSGEARDHLRRSAISRAIVRRMDRLVVPSGYLRDVFRQFGIEANVVPNLVDLARFRYRERVPLRPVLICTRPSEPYYAVDDVVRAFSHVQASYPEARLILLGGGSQESKIRDLVHQLQVRNVEFPGVVPRERMGDYYDQADICINASWLDNMPVSILEAFAVGTPLVSTAPDGITYIVEHGRTGLLSPPHDCRELGENVLRLLRDQILATTLARNGRVQSRAYHWNMVRGQWLQLYRSALGGKDQPPANESAAVTQNPLTMEAK